MSTLENPSPLSLVLADAWRELIRCAGGDPACARLRIQVGALPSDLGSESVPDWFSRLSEERKRQWAEIRVPERRQEWMTARRLELDLLDEVSPGENSLIKPKRPDSGVMGWMSSVSHTRYTGTEEGLTQAGVIAVAYSLPMEGGETLSGVGVDLERADRFVDPRIRSRLLGPSEEALAPGLLDLLDAWVIKEACFKSIPGNEATVLPDYVLTSWDPASGRGRARAPGGGECSFVLLRREGWVVAMAVSRSEP